MDHVPDTDDDPFEINVAGVTDENGIDAATVARCVRATLEGHGHKSGTVSVALVDDDTIARLHKEYMQIEGATDVLTFDLSAEEEVAVDGEIVISTDTAKRQATLHGHDVADEVALYAVHGVLHLLGYDDHSEADARRMHERENEILTQLGIGAVYGGTG